MKMVSVADIETEFGRYLKQSAEGPIVVIQNNRPVAVLVSVQDDEELERLILAYTPKFRRLLDAAEERIRQTGGVRHEELWAAVEKT